MFHFLFHLVFFFFCGGGGLSAVAHPTHLTPWTDNDFILPSLCDKIISNGLHNNGGGEKETMRTSFLLKLIHVHIITPSKINMIEKKKHWILNCTNAFFLKSGVNLYLHSGLTPQWITLQCLLSILNFCIFIKINILCIFLFNRHITRFVVSLYP